MEQNSVAKDFMTDLAKLLDEYEVEMLISDSRIMFTSKEYDYEIETSGYCGTAFNEVSLKTEIGTYNPKKV